MDYKRLRVSQKFEGGYITIRRLATYRYIGLQSACTLDYKRRREQFDINFSCCSRPSLYSLCMSTTYATCSYYNFT